MQIVSILPALPKAPTVSLFFVLLAKFPVRWPAKRILLLAGDVESTPGLTGVCRCSEPHHQPNTQARKTHTNTKKHNTQPNQNTMSNRHIHTTSKYQQHHKQTRGAQTTRIQYTTIITIQKTKLTMTSKTPKITNYTPVRTDREVKLILLKYIRHNIHQLSQETSTHTTQNYCWSESTQTGTNRNSL